MNSIIDIISNLYDGDIRLYEPAETVPDTIHVQCTFDRENDNFAELLCRYFDWSIISYYGIPDYTYDRDVEKLIRNLR